MTRYRVVRAGPHHVGQMVAVHLQAFQGFFLTFLGPAFLREFYRSLVEDGSGICWVAEDDSDSRFLGGVFGTASPEGFFKSLLVRRWWAFGFSSLWAVVRKPTILGRLLRAVAYRGDPPGLPGYALLSSIAVAPNGQRTGVGRSLLNAFVEEARSRSCAGAYLTTDAVQNDAVNRFYQNAGWVCESTFQTPYGRMMNRYVVALGGGRRQ